MSGDGGDRSQSGGRAVDPRVAEQQGAESSPDASAAERQQMLVMGAMHRRWIQRKKARQAADAAAGGPDSQPGDPAQQQADAVGDHAARNLHDAPASADPVAGHGKAIEAAPPAKHDEQSNALLTQLAQKTREEVDDESKQSYKVLFQIVAVARNNHLVAQLVEQLRATPSAKFGTCLNGLLLTIRLKGGKASEAILLGILGEVGIAPQIDDKIARLSPKERLFRAAKLGLPDVPEETLRQLVAAIPWMVGFWVASHLLGAGEIADLIGLGFLGKSAVDVVQDVVAFDEIAKDARSEEDLRIAGTHLTRAVAILGVTGLLAALGAAQRRTGRGAKTNTESENAAHHEGGPRVAHHEHQSSPHDPAPGESNTTSSPSSKSSVEAPKPLADDAHAGKPQKHAETSKPAHNGADVASGKEPRAKESTAESAEKKPEGAGAVQATSEGRGLAELPVAKDRIDVQVSDTGGELEMEFQARTIDGKPVQFGWGHVPLDEEGLPSGYPDFTLDSTAKIGGKEYAVHIYDQVEATGAHGEDGAPIAKGKGERTPVTRYALERFLSYYRRRFGQDPEKLQGLLAWTNKLNFQREWYKLRLEGLDKKAAAEQAVRKISFGRHRIAFGYDQFEVKLEGGESPVDLGVDPETGKALGTQRVPNTIRVWASRSKQ